MKDDVAIVTADKSEAESNRLLPVEGSDQDAAHFPRDDEVHQRHRVEIIPTPDVLLKFFESLHLRN